jgi:hypothetical protein
VQQVVDLVEEVLQVEDLLMVLEDQEIHLLLVHLKVVMVEVDQQIQVKVETEVEAQLLQVQ